MNDNHDDFGYLLLVRWVNGWLASLLIKLITYMHQEKDHDVIINRILTYPDVP